MTGEQANHRPKNDNKGRRSNGILIEVETLSATMGFGGRGSRLFIHVLRAT